jgi:hypothetical protein
LNGIEVDIQAATEQIIQVFDHRRMKSAFPKRPLGTSIFPIGPLGDFLAAKPHPPTDAA